VQPNSDQHYRAAHVQCAGVLRPGRASIFLKGLEADPTVEGSLRFAAAVPESEIELEYQAHQRVCGNAVRSHTIHARRVYARRYHVLLSKLR
jgi:hypothetical protein